MGPRGAPARIVGGSVERVDIERRAARPLRPLPPARRRRRFIGGSSATGAEGSGGRFRGVRARGRPTNATTSRDASTIARVHQRALPRGVRARRRRGGSASLLRAAAVAAQMESAKARAAAAAIRVHNRADDGGVARPPLTVDLHGLTVDGAIATLRTVLAGAARTDARAVRVVCGAGRHSVGGRARVAPAVRGFLEDEGVRFVDEGGGTLVVPLETR